MIETTVFTTGDLQEVKTWLDANASDIFDSISYENDSITCAINGVNTLVLSKNSNYMGFAIKLNNETTYTRNSAYVRNYSKAYKTDNGIYIEGLNGKAFSVAATKAGEVYGFDGNGSAHKVAHIDSPTFTDITAPTLFNVTTLCPAPYNNVSVSEDILIPIWSQIINTSDAQPVQIVQINDVNYVYDGYICLKE